MRSSKTLRCTPDMLYALAERLCLMAVEHPASFSDAHQSIMKRIEKEEYPQMKRMTQADTILFLLRKGHSLTNKSLMNNHKIAAPWKRISELRNRGHEIASVWKICPVDGSKYVTYEMSELEAA